MALVDTFINVAPSTYVNRYWGNSWIPCKDCKLEQDEYIADSCDGSFKFNCFHSISEDFKGFDSSCVDLHDIYWSCEHKEVFFSASALFPMERLASGAPSWYDIVENDFSIVPPPKSNALEKYVKEIDEHIKELETLKTDADYAKSKKIEAYVETKTELHSTLKNKSKKDNAPCKYMLMLSDNPKAPVYNYVDEKGCKKSHRHSSCWGWEYVDPKTGVYHAPHVCEKLHPGEKGWNNEWLKKAKFPSRR
jgi:hypothetical protein